MKKENIETIPVSTRVTHQTRNAITKVLKTNSHINIADYIRDLIRRDIDSRTLTQE